MGTNPLIQVARGTHEVSPITTKYQLLAAAETHIGQRVVLPKASDILAIKVEDDVLLIKFVRYDFRQMSSEVRFLAAYTVLRQWHRTPGQGYWAREDDFEVEQDDFQPVTIPEHGRTITTPAEWHAKRVWEADCYRPGTATQPMDNAARTSEGYTHDKMARHWSA
jgi:hypothetical protein